MAGRRTGGKMINRNGQDEPNYQEGDVEVKVSENVASDDDHNSHPPSRINKIPQQQPKTRATHLAAAAAPPKYLEPPNKQNNVNGIRRTQQRAAATSSRGGDHEYRGSGVVPRFAEWEEKDHVSGQGYTRAFERITDQRNMAGGGYVPSPSRPTPTPQRDVSMGWCFFWRRKYK